MLRAKVMGRQALMKRLNDIVPEADRYTAEAKLEAMQELADKVRVRAPTGATLDYMESLEGDALANRPVQEVVGRTSSKDQTAAGLFAKFIWRFLEFGTAPHNTAKGGGTVLGQMKLREGGGFSHPGSRAFPHIFPTWREYMPTAKKKVRNALNKAIRQARKK
jgi:hypothetical protein